MKASLAATLLVLGLAGEAFGQSPANAWPYGMDPVPDAVFDRGSWNFYGSDPVPQSATSDLGFRSNYGLDTIPEAYIPVVHSLRDTLPHQALDVLTRTIEGGALGGGVKSSQPARPRSPQSAPGACSPNSR